MDSSSQVIMQHNFLAVLPDVCRCRAMRVKQSGFALLGSAASHILDTLGPSQQVLDVQQLLPLCAAGLANGMTTMVSHNSSWAIGEIVLGGRVAQPMIDPHVETLLQGFCQILNR